MYTSFNLTKNSNSSIAVVEHSFAQENTNGADFMVSSIPPISSGEHSITERCENCKKQNCTE